MSIKDRPFPPRASIQDIMDVEEGTIVKVAKRGVSYQVPNDDDDDVSHQEKKKKKVPDIKASIQSLKPKSVLETL